MNDANDLLDMIGYVGPSSGAGLDWSTPQDKASSSDVYQQLMGKEKRVLDVVDRLVNLAQTKTVESSLFVNLSIKDVWRRTMHVMQDIMQESTRVKTPMQLLHVFLANDRKIYVGIVIIMVTLLVFFAHVTVTH